jgi:signal transduction histidine kinase
MAVCQDITQKKQADERLTESQQRYQRLSKQLALANKDLKVANQELRQANQQLSHLNEDLSRANSDLDNFIYTASHDLKAPILNIEGLVNSLLRQLPQENLQGERAGKTVGFIQDSVERFKQTIAHLTDIAKLQHQASQEATLLEVAPLLDAVQLDLAPVIEESKAKLEIDVSECPRIYFSEKNLRSIFYNLLSNAIKYRSPERALLVRISCQQQQGYQVLIVEDNGLGMDMSQEEKIFSMFKRLHDHVEGSGIGLYIVKKMLDNAGGKIEVKKSQVGVGSTFWVYFKLP